MSEGKGSLSLGLFLVLIFGFAGLASPQQAPPLVKPGAVVSVRRSGDPADSRYQDEIGKARELVAKGSVDAAISLLRGIVKQDPGNADAHLLLGTALALVPKRSEAIAELRRAIELRPSFAPAYNTLGMTLGRFVELDAARRAFEKAIELDPQLAEAHVNLALVFAQRKEFALAADHLDRALEIQGSSPAAAYSHYLRGKIYNEQNLPAEAAREFEKTIDLRPNYAEAYLDLGSSRRKLSDNAGSQKAFRKAVELAPANPTARYRLGMQYLRNGKAAQAVEHLREALRSQPENRAVLYNLGRALRNTGQTDEAKIVEQKLREILRSGEKSRANALVASQLNIEGIEFEESGNLPAAIEKYTAALEMDPLHAGFRRNLALALCRIGQWNQGIAELREVLRQNPDDEEATKALYIALEKAAAPSAATSQSTTRESKHD